MYMNSNISDIRCYVRDTCHPNIMWLRPNIVGNIAVTKNRSNLELYENNNDNNM